MSSYRVGDQWYKSDVDLKNNKMNWISVDDALPDYYERVLVVCTNPWSEDPVRHVSIATYFGKPYDGKTPAWSQHRNVTHWMRLPALPIIEKKGEDK